MEPQAKLPVTAESTDQRCVFPNVVLVTLRNMK
jgi:hypothetical protein